MWIDPVTHSCYSILLCIHVARSVKYWSIPRNNQIHSTIETSFDHVDLIDRSTLVYTYIYLFIHTYGRLPPNDPHFRCFHTNVLLLMRRRRKMRQAIKTWSCIIFEEELTKKWPHEEAGSQKIISYFHWGTPMDTLTGTSQWGTRWGTLGALWWALWRAPCKNEWKFDTKIGDGRYQENHEKTLFLYVKTSENAWRRTF